ncbi:MAG TPA: hypothetical protein VGF97_16275 [Rhizomicrobium sp.]|jgi:hypothetical protein
MVTLLVVVALIAITGFLCGRYGFPAGKEAFREAQDDARRIGDENVHLRAQLAASQADLQQLSQSREEERLAYQTLDEHARTLTAQVAQQARDVEAAVAARAKAEADTRSAEDVAARLREREAALLREVGSLVEQFQLVKSAREQALAAVHESVGVLDRLSEREQALTKNAAAIGTMAASRGAPMEPGKSAGEIAPANDTAPMAGDAPANDTAAITADAPPGDHAPASDGASVVGDAQAADVKPAAEPATASA